MIWSLNTVLYDPEPPILELHQSSAQLSQSYFAPRPPLFIHHFTICVPGLHRVFVALLASMIFHQSFFKNAVLVATLCLSTLLVSSSPQLCAYEYIIFSKNPKRAGMLRLHVFALILDVLHHTAQLNLLYFFTLQKSAGLMRLVHSTAVTRIPVMQTVGIPNYT